MTLKTQDGSDLALCAACARQRWLASPCCWWPAGAIAIARRRRPSKAQQVGECDGGGDPGAPVASNLTLVLSATSLPNNGTDTITATATATGAGGVTLESIPVTLQREQQRAGHGQWHLHR